MPVVFIHGVNVRDRVQNQYDAFAMGELLVERVLRPLAASGIGPFPSIRLDPLLMRVPFWGDQGVKFSWQGTTLPRLHATDILGGGEGDSSIPSQTQAVALAALLEQNPTQAAPNQTLLQAARTDFPLFIDIVLTPIIESEVRLVEDPDLETLVEEASWADQNFEARPLAGPLMEAWLVMAAEEVAGDTELKRRVDTQFQTDDQLIDEIEKRLLDRFGALVKQHSNAKSATSPGADVLEVDVLRVDVLGGGVGGALKEATDRIKEFFVRAMLSPIRATSVTGLKVLRGRLHSEFTRFSGDIFEYLLRRGNAEQPGRIVESILAELDVAMAKRPGEPLIVITHSMGGNIFYDILTHYRPELKVALWLSVGGQVGLFEEMKLFHASDRAIGLPKKVDQLGSRVSCWLNVYDPADPVAFLAEPVFQKVKDVRYSTGSGDYHTHLNYFKRSRLYRMLYAELAEAFKK